MPAISYDLLVESNFYSVHFDRTPVAFPRLITHFVSMGRTSSITPTRIKIGGVEVLLQPQPQKGKLTEETLRRAVSKAVESERTGTKKR
jgi:hypothetical protein